MQPQQPQRVQDAGSTARLFVAIELPEALRERLAAVQEQLRLNLGASAGVVRWSRPEGIHLTLQFLGDVPTAKIPALHAGIQRAARGIGSFSLEVGGLGAFPNARRPRVLWVGMSGNVEAAMQLGEAVQHELASVGYEADKPFSPHLTLGRVRGDASPDQLAALSRVLSLTAILPPEQGGFPVEGVSLMQSFLQSGGSVYKQVGHFALGQLRS